MRKQSLKLTGRDFFFLRWLRHNYGKCEIPGNTDLGKYYRVINSGCIEVQLDRFRNVLRFTLTDAGRGTIEAKERQQLPAKPKRLRSRPTNGPP
jgi:hypothetical protein